MNPSTKLYALTADALAYVEQALVCIEAAERLNAVDIPLDYWDTLRSIAVELDETISELEWLTDKVEAHLESIASTEVEAHLESIASAEVEFHLEIIASAPHTDQE
jgi:hypothetical protein